VVVSLGTNDAYTRNFNVESYRQQYDTLIRRIRTALPGIAILLTVPNDSYLYRRYTNANTEKVRKGYTLKGDLFFNAFLNSYDDYIVDILPSLKERDSSGFYEAWDSTPSRFLVGFC